MAVLVIALSIAGGFVLPWIPLVLVAMVVLAMFSAGIALMLSIANVHFRDTQYFVSIIMQIWMYLTPVIYPVSLVDTQSQRVGGLLGTGITFGDIYRLNPMEHFVTLFRQLMYDNRWPDPMELLICTVWALVSLALGVLIFRRSERDLAELL